MNTTNYAILDRAKYESSGAALTARSMAPKELASMLDNDNPTNNSIPEDRRPYWSDEHECYLVPLTKGMFAKVDPDIAGEVGRYKWYASDSGSGFYARRKDARGNNGRVRYLHHFIAGKIPGMVVDHINGNTLDNRSVNLRLTSHSTNRRNQHVHNRRNTSGYRGVYWHVGTRKWRAYIKMDGKQIHLGLFDDAESAAKARDEATIIHFGTQSFLNFPLKDGEEGVKS